MSYKKLTALVSGKSLPVAGRNEHGEVVTIERGSFNGRRFFKVTTAQGNNWCRINTYYENGDIEETYRR